MDFDSYRECVLLVLGDEGGRRFSDGLVRMGLRQALQRYEQWFPEHVRVSCKVARVDGSRVVLQFVPVGDQVVFGVQVGLKRFGRDDYVEYRTEGSLVLDFGAGRPCVAGDVVFLDVSGHRGIRGLDGKGNTSVPDGHSLMLSSGAAGCCLLMRARMVTEVFGKRPEDGESMTLQGRRLLGEFEDELFRLCVGLGSGEVLPGHGWD